MKLTRYDGHVPLFSQNMEGRERTLFGSTVQDDDINNQFTPEFLRGWGSVGSTEFPTLQDFNALAYTHNKLLSYLYQAGIPSYTQNEEYYIGSIVQYNKDIYICLRDNPTVLPTDTNAWKRVQESLTFVGNGPEVMKKGAFGLGVPNPPPVISPSMLDANQFGAAAGGGSIGWFDGYSPFLHVRRYTGSGGRSFTINSSYIKKSLAVLFEESGVFDAEWSVLHATTNTRTDANKVLHAGTATPINTLNVSDMSQEVIDNDLLTVTSGAVYRALQPKADLTYVNTELDKKRDHNDNRFIGWLLELFDGHFDSIGLFVGTNNKERGFYSSRTGGQTVYLQTLQDKNGVVALTNDGYLKLGAEQSVNDVTNVPANSVMTRINSNGTATAAQWTVYYRPILAG